MDASALVCPTHPCATACLLPCPALLTPAEPTSIGSNRSDGKGPESPSPTWRPASARRVQPTRRRQLGQPKITAGIGKQPQKTSPYENDCVTSTWHERALRLLCGCLGVEGFREWRMVAGLRYFAKLTSTSLVHRFHVQSTNHQELRLACPRVSTEIQNRPKPATP